MLGLTSIKITTRNIFCVFNLYTSAIDIGVVTNKGR